LVIKRVIVICYKDNPLLVTKILTNSLLISYGIRVDTTLYLVTGKGSCIEFRGKELRGLNPDVRSAMGFLKAILRRKVKVPGVYYLNKLPRLRCEVLYVLRNGEGSLSSDLFHELARNPSSACLLALCGNEVINELVSGVRYAYMRFLSPQYLMCLDQLITVFHYVIDRYGGAYIRRAGRKGVTHIPPMR